MTFILNTSWRGKHLNTTIIIDMISVLGIIFAKIDKRLQQTYNETNVKYNVVKNT